MELIVELIDSLTWATPRERDKSSRTATFADGDGQTVLLYVLLFVANLRTCKRIEGYDVQVSLYQ